MTLMLIRPMPIFPTPMLVAAIRRQPKVRDVERHEAARRTAQPARHRVASFSRPSISEAYAERRRE